MANDKNSITPIGFYNFRGNRDKKFGIKIDDRRRHIYVVGKTGVASVHGRAFEGVVKAVANL